MSLCQSSRISAFIILLLLSTVGSLPSGLAAPAQLTIEPNDVIKKADELLLAGKPEQALRALRTVYSRVQDPRILVRMGRAHLRRSEPSEAEHYCRLAQSARDEAVRGLANQCIEDSIAAKTSLKSPFSSSLPAPKGESQNSIKIDVSPKPVFNPVIKIDNRTPEKQIVLPMPSEKTPLHRRWWLWSGVAAVVAAGVVIGAVVPTYRRPDWPDAVILATQP